MFRDKNTFTWLCSQTGSKLKARLMLTPLVSGRAHSSTWSQVTVHSGQQHLTSDGQTEPASWNVPLPQSWVSVLSQSALRNTNSRTETNQVILGLHHGCNRMNRFIYRWETAAVAMAWSPALQLLPTVRRNSWAVSVRPVATGPAHTILTAMKGSKWGGSQNVRTEHMCLGENWKH